MSEPETKIKEPVKASPVEKVKVLVATLVLKLKARKTSAKKAPKDPARWSSTERAYHELTAALVSKNQVSRRMATLFFMSAAGVVLVFVLTLHRLVVRYRIQHEETVRLERVHHRQEEILLRAAESAKDQQRWADLGLYSVEVYPDVSSSSSIKNRVEIQFGARCVDRETREFLDARQAELRSEISNLLIALQRDELLTPVGKYRLKKKILEKLNGWIYGEYPKGRVEEVFISNLSIS